MIQLSHAQLRPWQTGDEGSTARHANDRAIWRNLRDVFPHPYTYQDAVAWIGLNEAAEVTTKLAIVVDGEASGGIGIQLRDDVSHRTAEIGYWLGRNRWGRGIMTEAVRATTKWAFENFDLIRLEAAVFEWNPASVRVLEKAGYEFEGTLRKSVTKDGETTNSLLYAVVR